jgi:hypothetical protein
MSVQGSEKRRRVLVATLVSVAVLSGPASGLAAGGHAPDVGHPTGNGPDATLVRAGLVSRQPLRADGRWLRDEHGRVVVLHGLFGVWKTAAMLPPDSESDPTGFTATDAEHLKRMGLNAFRLAWFWRGLEPVRGRIETAYLDRMHALVTLLGQHGLFTVLDSHQDMYNERFGGLGFPDWTVFDDGIPMVTNLGFPGNYFQPATSRAFDNLWANSHRLWAAYGRAWKVVAARFAREPMVIGYDIMNEPWPGSAWPTCTTPAGCPPFDARLSRAQANFARAILGVDPHHLVFYEPHFFFSTGVPSWLRRQRGLPPAGLSFHDLLPAARRLAARRRASPRSDVVLRTLRRTGARQRLAGRGAPWRTAPDHRDDTAGCPRRLRARMPDRACRPRDDRLDGQRTELAERRAASPRLRSNSSAFARLPASCRRHAYAVRL